MEQATQMYNWAALAIPVLLALIPAFLFYTGYRFSRSDSSSFAGKSFYWLGGHGVTLVIVTALTLLRGVCIPDMVVTQLPLIVTVAYLVAGFAFRSSFLFSLGLATPGLWMFLMKSWEAFSGNKEMLYVLPLDPFWYLLAAAVIFALQYLKRPKEFWEEAESSLVVISGSYLMGAFWLLALAQGGLLSGVGVNRHIWSLALLAVSAFLLWCANHLRDPLFAGCSVIGISAGAYTFISYYPWG
jgi:hypothetical protein